MKDSRIKSLTEAVCNIIVGYSVNFAANVAILPHFGIPFDWGVYGLIGLLYTGVSLLRSYVIRRLFVNGFYETFVHMFQTFKKQVKQYDK
jgi:hypothetical protein